MGNFKNFLEDEDVWVMDSTTGVMEIRADGPMQIVARYEGRGTCAGPFSRGSDAVLELMQKGWCRCVPRDADFGPTPEHVKTYIKERCSRQNCRPLPPNRDVVSRAQEQYHTQGSHGESIRVRSSRTNKHRPAVTPSKEERKQEIKRRRDEAQRKKGFMGLVYEGIFDMKMEVEDKTLDGFGELFDRVLVRLKDALNNNKIMIKHVLQVDAGDAARLLFGLALAVVGCIAVVSFHDAPVLVKWIILGATAASSVWACGELIQRYVVAPLTNMFVGKTVDERVAEAQRDILECQEEFERYMNAPLHPPVDCESMFSEKWETPRTNTSYEGLLSMGGSAAFTALTEVAAGVVSLVTGSLFTGGTKGLGEKLAKHNRTSSEVKMIFTETLRWIADKIDKVFGTNFSSHFRKNAVLEAWADEVGAFYNKYSEGKMKMTATTGRRVQKYILRGLDIARKYESMDHTSWNLHRFCMQLLHKVESAHGAAGVATMERQVPLTVVLRGESGIGKSYIQHGLCDEIALRVITDEEDRLDYAANHNSEKYMWSEEEDHVNGYFGQFSVIFDDFGQFLTQKGQTDDFIRLIRLANAAPYRLNCAEMERKGRVMFTSPLILCSTNLYQYWGPSLAKNEALVRRFDVMIDMVPRVEYCTDETANKSDKEKRLDKNKLGSVLEYDACEYRLMKPVDNVQQVWVLDRVMTFAEMVEVCVEKFNEHKSRHLAMMDKLGDRRIEILEEMRKTGGSTQCEYEGLFGWFKPKAAYQGVCQEIAKLKHDIRLGIALFKSRYGSRSWQAYVAFAIVLFGAVALFTGIVCGLLRCFKNKVACYSDPGVFMDNFARNASETYGHDFDFAGMRAMAGLKRTNKWIAEVRKGIVEDGCVRAFGQELKCSVATFDKWVKSFGQPDYEAMLCNDNSNVRSYPNMLMRSIMDKNVYHMYRPFDDPEEVDSAGKITMVTGTIGMMNYHYLAEMRNILSDNDPDMMHVVLVNHKNPARKYSYNLAWFLDEQNVSVDVESDIVLVQFPKSMPVHRDIVKHFVTRDTIQQNRDCDITMFAPRGPRCVEMFDIGKRRLSRPIEVRGNVHTNVLQYRAHTQTGDCGSLLSYSGDYTNFTERICGVHMAGETVAGEKRGYASIVTRDVIEGLLTKFGSIPKIISPVEAEGSFLPNYNLCHEFVRKIERPIYQPTKTAIVASKLHGEIGPVTKKPAALRPVERDGLWLDPLVNAHKRQDSYNVTVDEDLLGHVKEHVYQTLKPFIRHTARRLSFQEAVQGAPDLPCIGPIPRSTSAGFSYKDDPRVKSGKKEFFGSEGPYDFSSDLCADLRRRVEEFLEKARRGIVPEDRVFTDILKDENLALLKVLIAKTRMISACDLPLTVIYRMFYAALCNDLVASRILNEIAVGINPYSREWDYLARHLQSKGRKVIAGDFSGYDNSQSCQLIHATVEVMNRLTGHTSESDKLVMDVLAVTLAQPYHASRDTIYELDHGMPSGNPMTTIMNSIFGMIAFRLCWLKCSFGRYITPSLALADFPRHVALVMYGDDNLLNVSDEASEFFNQNTMIAAFPTFGLTYTSDKKEDVAPPPHREITEVTFLKRAFRFCEDIGAYIAPLDKETIINMLHWTKKGGSSVSITIDNCGNALREWSLHGRDYYEQRSRELREAALRCMEHDLIVPPYKHALLEVCSFVPSWIREHM